MSLKIGPLHSPSHAFYKQIISLLSKFLEFHVSTPTGTSTIDRDKQKVIDSQFSLVQFRWNSGEYVFRYISGDHRVSPTSVRMTLESRSFILDFTSVIPMIKC